MRKFLLFLLSAGIGASAVFGATPQVKLLWAHPVADHMGDATNCTGLAKAPNGDYLVCFNNKGDAAAGSTAYILRSTDAGKTWSREPEYTLKGEGLDGVALSLCNLPDGSVLKTELVIKHLSTDRKAVWQPRVSVAKLFRSTDSAAKNFEHITDLELDGAILAPMGTVTQLANGDLIYPLWRSGQIKKLPGVKYGSGFHRSTDGGKTWGDFELVFKDNPPEGETPYSFNESAFLVRDDGSVVGFARHDGHADHGMFRVISTDNGKTWSDPVKTDVWGKFPCIVKLPKGGYFMVCGKQNARPHPRTDYMYYSEDGLDFTELGPAYYSRTDGKPRNSATGGAQCILLGPGEDEIFFVFYAFDPKLKGYHQTYIDSNFIKLIR